MFTDPETQAALLDAPGASRYLGPAEVVMADGTTATVAIGMQQVDATVAVLDYAAAAGDQVLLIGDHASGFYVIGVLHAPRQRRRISVEQGDLELVAPSGSIRLISGGGVDVTSMQPIDLRSRVAVRMSIFGSLGKALSRLRLTGRCTELRSEQIEMESSRVRLKAEDARIESERLRVEGGNVDLSARRVSIVTEVLFNKARNAYHKVAQLWQLTAGRSRMVIDETSHHKAKRIYSKADEDVKINAKQIHLG